MSEPDPKAPVEWDELVPHRRHTCLQCEDVFERQREEIDADASVGAAVRTLYAAWHDDYGEATGTGQGGASVFAYLLERAAIADLEEWSAVEPASLVAREPDDEELRRRFWEAEQVPWWLAVRYGVHYSLVQYWLYAADVPLMWRNLSPTLRELVGSPSGD